MLLADLQRWGQSSHHTDEALIIDATITAEMGNVSYARDFLSAHASGLVRGLSPGFRVSPRGELIEERADAIIRTVRSAELVEISAVTRPAYPEAQIEARNWQTGIVSKSGNNPHFLNRWRL